MRSILATMACVVGVTATVVAFAGPGEHHVRVPFESENGSHITGWVNVVAMPQGGTRVQIQAEGLEPNTTYTSFYYESTDCSAPADELVSFTSGADGRVHVSGKTDEDLDEIGTISIRLGPEYGELEACAALHETTK